MLFATQWHTKAIYVYIHWSVCIILSLSYAHTHHTHIQLSNICQHRTILLMNHRYAIINNILTRDEQKKKDECAHHIQNGGRERVECQNVLWCSRQPDNIAPAYVSFIIMCFCHILTLILICWAWFLVLATAGDSPLHRRLHRFIGLSSVNWNISILVCFSGCDIFIPSGVRYMPL